MKVVCLGTNVKGQVCTEETKKSRSTLSCEDVGSSARGERSGLTFILFSCGILARILGLARIEDPPRIYLHPRLEMAQLDWSESPESSRIGANASQIDQPGRDHFGTFLRH